MPAKKREMTIRLVADSAKVSSFIESVFALADDVTVTCKVIERSTRRAAAKSKAAATTMESPAVDSEQSHRSHLAYIGEEGAAYKRRIDVEASLKKLGLDRQELLSRAWPKGSPQHRLKRAAAISARANGAADGR